MTNKKRRPRALITGASSGIGAAFAERLAAKRYHLVVVARRTERLEELARRLRDAHGIEVEVITADLTSADDLRRVEERAAAEPAIDLLVNNAGVGSHGAFATLDPDREEREIRLNVIALVRLTRAVLPGMLDRNRGGIINVASVAGFLPGPFGATYGATKAYVISFSEALYEELRGTGVRVQALAPGFTRTEFQDSAEVSTSTIPDAIWSSAEAVVDQSLRGLNRDKAVVVPDIQYKVVSFAVNTLPRGLVRRVWGSINRRRDRRGEPVPPP
jgi:uncharacterized protein